jgi:hypothetical protein
MALAMPKRSPQEERQSELRVHPIFVPGRGDLPKGRHPFGASSRLRVYFARTYEGESDAISLSQRR